MSVSRFNCPECESVLKPAKPLPEGKKIKCPKCGAGITVPGEAQTAVTAKASAGSAKSATAPKKKKEEDEGGTYGMVQESQAEVERREKDIEKRRRVQQEQEEEYDPRGPAQAAVVRPTNRLLWLAGSGAAGWFLMCLFLLILTCFPPPKPVDDPDDPRANWKKTLEMGEGLHPIRAVPKDPDEESRAPSSADMVGFSMFLDLGLIYKLIYCFAYFFWGVYECVIIYGAVKVQKLESRAWGYVAAIMIMIPINVTPFSNIIAFFCLLIGILIFGFWKGLIVGLIVFGLVIFGLWMWGILAGLKTIMALGKPEVIEGFEYEPD